MTTRTYGNYEPTLEEFKAHIRMTSYDLDTDLRLKLQAAIRSAEHYIGLVIAQSVFTYTGDYAKTLTLEAPVTGVTGVKVDGVALSNGDWSLSGNTLTVQTEGTSMEVTYTAGMSTVDPDIKAAILLHAAALFNNPVDSVEVLPKASTRLLDPYRTWGVK